MDLDGRGQTEQRKREVQNALASLVNPGAPVVRTGVVAPVPSEKPAAPAGEDDETAKLKAELAAAKKEIEMLKMRQELEAARAEIARMKAGH